jgi:hypothetical protein
MSGVPYVGLETVVNAGPELLSGLVAKLRSIDLLIRARLSLPLFCPDLSMAVSVGTGSTGLVLVRDGDRYGVHLQEYSRRNAGRTGGAVASGVPPLHSSNAAQSAPDTVIADAPTAVSRPGMPQRMRSTATPRIVSSKAAEKAAALRAAEDRVQRCQEVSAASHCLHGVSVLLQVCGGLGTALTCFPSC